MATKIGTKTHGAPVAGFDMEFEWYEEWVALFDKQIELIRLQIGRARGDGDTAVARRAEQPGTHQSV